MQNDWNLEAQKAVAWWFDATATQWAKQADQNLSTATDSSLQLPTDRRRKKDALKLRALRSVDYRAHHKNADRGLGDLAIALAQPPEWHNVDESRGAAEHGEMTVESPCPAPGSIT